MGVRSQGPGSGNCRRMEGPVSFNKWEGKTGGEPKDLRTLKRHVSQMIGFEAVWILIWKQLLRYLGKLEY